MESLIYDRIGLARSAPNSHAGPWLTETSPFFKSILQCCPGCQHLAGKQERQCGRLPGKFCGAGKNHVIIFTHIPLASICLTSRMLRNFSQVPKEKKK